MTLPGRIHFRAVLRDLPQKAKLKLGKGKKAPSNATDTSFKARCEGIAIDPSSDVADGDSHL